MTGDTFFGMRVCESVMAVRTVVRRVPGGYMNRWLIREVAVVPCIVIARSLGVMLVHPTLMPKLQSARMCEWVDRRCA